MTEYQWQTIKNSLNLSDPANRGLILEIESQNVKPISYVVEEYDNPKSYTIYVNSPICISHYEIENITGNKIDSNDMFPIKDFGLYIIDKIKYWVVRKD